MPRARNVKPSFFRNEVLASLPAHGRLLFIGLWTLADRDGRIEDRPKRIKVDVFPYEDVEIDSLLAQLASDGFIIRYAVGGVGVIQIANWEKNGSPYKSEPSLGLPGPPLEQVATSCNDFSAPPAWSGERGRGKEEGSKEQEGGAVGSAGSRPLAEFVDSAEGLAQEFADAFDGPYSAAERDVRQVTPTIRAVLGFGFTPAQIRAEITRHDRDRNEKLWQFKRRFEDKKQARASPDPSIENVKKFAAKGKEAKP